MELIALSIAWLVGGFLAGVLFEKHPVLAVILFFISVVCGAKVV